MRLRGPPARAVSSTPAASGTHLGERVAKWWVPERFEFIDEVPKTSVGKFDKKLLRARFAASEAAVGSESR